ncbi:unnamed protein product [Enterobius vermicularis]|uniref:DNA-directed RNA polymerase n=1 Tax=Enterobius vermicularis TaxID=51028 RepID=A0A0N4V6I9_ENTVE|nr:unnamed protein product [Enterobius vermicularis]
MSQSASDDGDLLVTKDIGLPKLEDTFTLNQLAHKKDLEAPKCKVSFYFLGDYFNSYGFHTYLSGENSQ